MDNLGKIGRSLMDNFGGWGGGGGGGGGIGQLINILFCGYQRRSEIRHRKSDIHQKCMPKPILAWAQVPNL
jgi:hypothetical protein